MRISGAAKKSGLAVLLAALMLTGGMGLRAQEPAKIDDSGQQMTPAAASPEAEKDESEAYLHSATVQKIAKLMGMKTETASTLFVVLNFGILAIAVGGFLAKALPKTLRDRTSSIQKELANARSATEEANVRLNSVEARLAKLDGQISEMKAQAEKDGAAEEQRLRASADDEKNKILASAEQEIASATQQAQRQLQQYAAGLAIEQAAKRLVISAETDRLLVKNFAQRLGDRGPGNRGGEN